MSGRRLDGARPRAEVPASPAPERVSEISADWVLPVSGPPIEGGRVRFENGVITAVEQGRAERHYLDAVILPGFVNAHSHLEYAVYAGFGDGTPFGPWIATHMERKSRLDRSDMAAIARCGVVDSLASGITTTADYSFSGAAATAAAELGLRAIVYLEVFGGSAEEARRQFEEKRATVSEDGLVHIGVSPHAPYTCSLEVYEWCLSLGLPVGTHLAESTHENEWLEHGTGPLSAIAPFLQPPTGRRAVATLEPVLSPGLLCAHCVDVDAGELTVLAARSVPVAHCPRSNALLGCGSAPLADMRAAGLTVGLGTDSPASAPSFDIFDELRAAIYVARSRERRADALSPTEVVALATVEAARALRIDDQVGTLSAGKRADLAVVSLAESPHLPIEDPAAAVVFGGSPQRVLETFVDGKSRYRREEEAEWQEVRSIASAARRKMLALRP